MPFGFSDFMRKEDKSEKTIENYVLVINQFFSFLDSNYPSRLEVFEIGIKHIDQFLKDKRKTCNNITMNKNISILKRFFDYLWRENLIPVDPMSKVKSLKFSIEAPSFTYQTLLDLKPKILNSDKYTLRDKVIYILSLHGISYSELLFTKDDVHIVNSNVLINVKGKHNTHRTIYLKGVDAEVFYIFYEQSLFRNSEYVFVSKRRNIKEENYVPIYYDRIKDTLKAFRENEPELKGYTLTTAKNAYIHYLKTDRKFTFEQISYFFGANQKSISQTTQNILERYQKITS